VCVCVSVSVCMCVRVCIYIYVYVYIYNDINRHEIILQSIKMYCALIHIRVNPVDESKINL